MSTTTEPVQIDSRKFMKAINNSAQAKVHLFESLVKKLAKKTNSRYHKKVFVATELQTFTGTYQNLMV